MSSSWINRNPSLLLIPFFACLLIFWLVPLIGGVRMSLFSNELYGEARFVGWEHYRHLLRDDRYFKAISNTVIYTASSIALILPIAVGLAHLIRASFPRLRPLFTFSLLLPGLTPPAVLALLFLLVFHGKEGLLNQWFVTPLGFQPINWLKDPSFVLPALIIQSLWRWTGFITFFVLAGMDAIPRALYEATELVTQSRWHHFRFITLPLLRHVLLFAGIYLMVDAFSLFSGSYVLLGGSGGTADSGLLLISYAYQAFSFGQMGTAAAIGSSMAPLLLAVLWLCLTRARRVDR